jgi:hypothetical protein
LFKSRIMRYLWSLSAVLFLIATPLHGQSITSPYKFVESRHTFEAFAGAINVDPGRNNQAPESGAWFGGRYNIHFAGPVSGEVGFGLSPTTRSIYAMDADTVNFIRYADTKMTFLVIDAGLRFHFTGRRTWHGIAPFAVVTAGVVTDVNSSSVLETLIPPEQFFKFGAGFASSIGLGSEVFIGDRFSLRGEFRDYLWRLTYPGGITATGSRQSEWTHNFAPTLGGALHF